MVSLLIEICADEVDGLSHCLSNDFEPRLDTSMRVSELPNWLNVTIAGHVILICRCRNMKHNFGMYLQKSWNRALACGLKKKAQIRKCHFILCAISGTARRYEGCRWRHAPPFHAAYPHNRHNGRIQTVSRFAYGEIRDNLAADSCRPIDLLRCKLSFFGASKFDPKSDRWTRVTLFQGAPIPADIAAGSDDDWLFATSPPPPQGHITEPE